MKLIQRLTLPLVAGLLVLTTGAANAAPPDDQAPAEQETITVVDTTVEDMTADGDITSSETTSESTSSSEMTTQKSTSKKYTKSSASGCRKVTTTWKEYSASGIDHLYTYKNALRWCWNRAKKSTSGVQYTWDYSIDNGYIKWTGQEFHKRGQYAAQGAPSSKTSAVKSHRKGGFENCILGKCGFSYPYSDIRGYWNGTWRATTGR